MIWEAAEQITVSVAGYNLRLEIIWMAPTVKTLNEWETVIHTGRYLTVIFWLLSFRLHGKYVNDS